MELSPNYTELLQSINFYLESIKKITFNLLPCQLVETNAIRGLYHCYTCAINHPIMLNTTWLSLKFIVHSSLAALTDCNPNQTSVLCVVGTFVVSAKCILILGYLETTSRFPFWQLVLKFVHL